LEGVTMAVHIYDAAGNLVEVYVVPDPEPTPEELARQSAVAKLQALGLTEAEALALVGGAP
jgi:hypothetical protein